MKEFDKRISASQEQNTLGLIVDAQESATIRAARSVLGANMFGIEEWLSFFPGVLAGAGIAELPPFPWSAEVLNSPCPFESGKTVGQTHFAFLGIAQCDGRPLSISRWRRMRPYLFEHVYWGKLSFYAATTCSPRWYLMPLEPPFPRLEPYSEQVRHLPAAYEVGLVVEETTKLILSRRLLGERAPSLSWNWCRDSEFADTTKYISPPRRIAVGGWDTDLLGLDLFLEDLVWEGGFRLSISRKTI